MGTHWPCVLPAVCRGSRLPGQLLSLSMPSHAPVPLLPGLSLTSTAVHRGLPLPLSFTLPLAQMSYSQMWVSRSLWRCRPPSHLVAMSPGPVTGDSFLISSGGRSGSCCPMKALRVMALSFFVVWSELPNWVTR